MWSKRIQQIQIEFATYSVEHLWFPSLLQFRLQIFQIFSDKRTFTILHENWILNFLAHLPKYVHCTWIIDLSSVCL